jgi:hypothetical protein
MSIQIKTHKMLWGRSGNLCAFPDCNKELVMDISETDDLSVVGEEAHIVAREPDGPRGDSPLTPEQRDKYDNLILMCSIHHKVIDDHPDIYTIEILHNYKKNHENWIRQNLGLDTTKQREDEVYASYVDDFLRLVDIENYKAWTSYMLSGDSPRISKEQYDKLRELINYILSRVWFNRYPDLEKALINLKNVLNDLLKVFDEHSEDIRNGEEIWTKKFYKIDRWDEELYEELSEKHTYHVNLIIDLTLEFTRATNYFFDKVRQYIVPSFRISDGVLLVEKGPFMDLTWRTYRVEYKPEERVELPYPGLRVFMEIRNNRDISWGNGVSEDYFPKFD